MSRPSGPPSRICPYGVLSCVTVKTLLRIRPLCERCIEDSIRGFVGKEVPERPICRKLKGRHNGMAKG